MRAKVRHNTAAEEAAIQRGIAQDPDNPERGDEFFASAKPANEALPSKLHTELMARRRGPGKRPKKALVTLRVDPDVLDGLRASGPGWQTRLSDILRKAVRGTS